MINKKLTFKRYEIILIRLDLLCDWSYDFIILYVAFYSLTLLVICLEGNVDLDLSC